MITHQSIAEWRGKDLVDRDLHKIGKLEDVYVDVENDEPDRMECPAPRS